MIQRDKIMEDLMFKKNNSTFFIDKTTSIKTDINGNVISSKDRYRVSPSLPNETDKNAVKLEAELNAGKNISIFDMDFSNTNIWDEISENFDTYLETFFKEKQSSKKRVSKNTIKNMRSGFRYLKLFFSKGCVPDLKYYKHIQNIMEMLPKNYLRSPKWKKVSIQEIEKKFDKSPYETLNTKTINKHMNFHKQFFAWLEYNDDKYTTNMHKLLPLFEEDAIVKFEYSKQDLHNIFNYDLDPEYKDFFNIAFHTGMRLSEIVNLTSDNIHITKDEKIQIDNCIKVFKGKTKNAIRLVPLHDNIKEMVLERARKTTTKNKYLIFNGNVSATGKKLNRVLNQIVPDPSKSLHSFRKNFSQGMTLSMYGEREYKDFLMGHSNNSVGHVSYDIGLMNAHKLKEIIDNIVLTY